VLLTEIVQLKEEAGRKAAECRPKASDDGKELVKQGEAIRKRAMEGMSKKGICSVILLSLTLSMYEK